MKIKFIILSMIAAVAFVACGKGGSDVAPVEPGITLASTADAVIPAAGGNVQVKFSSTENWTARISGTWATVSPDAGEAGKDLSVTISVAEANEEYDDLTAVLTLAADSNEKTVNVIQSKKGALILLSEASVALDADGGEFTVETQGNDPVSAEVVEGDDWIIPANEGAKGLVDYNFTFSVAANDTYLDRSGKIVISNAFNSKQITVSQKGKPVTWPTAQEGDYDYNIAPGATHKASMAATGFEAWIGNGYDKDNGKKITGVITADGMTYGGPGLQYAGNRVALDKLVDQWSDEYEDIIPSARYFAFKVNRPGTLRFYPAVVTTDNPSASPEGTPRTPTYNLAIVKKVNGETTAEILYSIVPDPENIANSNDTANRSDANIKSEGWQHYWVSFTVTKEDLLGIDEAATLYLYHMNPKVNTLSINYWPLEWTVAEAE